MALPLAVRRNTCLFRSCFQELNVALSTTLLKAYAAFTIRTPISLLLQQILPQLFEAYLLASHQIAPLGGPDGPALRDKTSHQRGKTFILRFQTQGSHQLLVATLPTPLPRALHRDLLAVLARPR